MRRVPVEIKVEADGSLTGYYRTELGAPDAKSRFALTGWAQDEVIAFSSNFIGFSSMTS